MQRQAIFENKNSDKSKYCALADPVRRRRNPHQPPQRDSVLSFLHTFLPKSARIGGRRPQLVVAPQREILDPPL